MTERKSVGQVLIETYAKNQRESYDRYMYRKYKESRAQAQPSLQEQIDDLQKQCVMLRHRVSELEKLKNWSYTAPPEEWDRKKD